MLGVIIASTPRIQNLELLNYSGAHWIEGDYVLEPGHLDFSDMFRTIAKAQTFSIAWIPGLATLTSLSSNCLLSSHFTTLPDLINLRFDLPNEGQELLPQPPRSADVCASKICRLGVTLDQKSLSADGWRDRYKYSRQLSERLHKLRHLDLVIKPVLIGDPWSRDYGEAGGSYAILIEKFLSASIETFTIDTTLLNNQDNQNLRIGGVALLAIWRKIQREREVYTLDPGAASDRLISPLHQASQNRSRSGSILLRRRELLNM
jgi:hypothetical protein